MNPVLEVFEFWQQAARHPRARLDDKRSKDISKALRWGYSVDDLKLAVFGCCANPRYGGGQNDRNTIYTHIGLILRDADHIDRFMRDGTTYLTQAWYDAKKEDEHRRPRQEIPSEARTRMLELVRKKS